MRWSKEKAWKWYNARPWIRGCNYMSADCANRVDQWQELGFEERFETTESELELMKDTGFNAVRLILEYVVWKEEHDGFMERFERYISLCAKYGISCMIVLANDCMPPKNEFWKMPYVGKQEYVWGYHGGKKSAQHSLQTSPAPHFYLDDPESRADYFRMVEEIVTKWAAEHPRKTMADRFFELLPNAPRSGSGKPFICAKHLGWANKSVCDDFDCCEECWNRPWEEGDTVGNK